MYIVLNKTPPIIGKEMGLEMTFIPPIAKMDILIIYKFQLYRCFGFSFIQIQDYGRQNLALAKEYFCWVYMCKVIDTSEGTAPTIRTCNKYGDHSVVSQGLKFQNRLNRF